MYVPSPAVEAAAPTVFMVWPLARDIKAVSNYENNQHNSLCRLVYYSKSPLHVSGNVFAHHQEHLTVFTVSGSVHPSWWRLELTPISQIENASHF
jgi:hypothetical protein